MDFLEKLNITEMVEALEELLSFIPYGTEIVLTFVGIAAVRWGAGPID